MSADSKVRRSAPAAGLTSFGDDLNRVRWARVTALLVDPEALFRRLPPEMQAEYERCQQSIIDARAHAQRHAHEIWIG